VKEKKGSMKISVCGKGGAGKSVIVTLLANEFRARGYRVLVVDSDESNSSLYRILGFDHPPVPLMELVGGKRGLKDKMAVRFSSGEAEVKMEVLSQDRILVKDIPSQHIVQRDGIRLMNIGKILHSLEGCACPMGVLSREFLRKVYLEADEVAIVDMEAGVEHFGRGVETSVDRVLVIVEPSLESLELALKVKELAAGAGVTKTWAVLNKINSDEISARLKKELGKRGMEVIGIVSYSQQVFDACLEGHKLGENLESTEVRRLVDNLLSK
jgi:CO dehydrogenase maturation factor